MRPRPSLRNWKPTCAAGGDAGAGLRLLLGRGTVLAGDVLGDVLPLRAHLRIQLEGLEPQVHGNLAFQLFQRALQGSKADGAPGHATSETKSIFRTWLMPTLSLLPQDPAQLPTDPVIGRTMPVM